MLNDRLLRLLCRAEETGQQSAQQDRVLFQLFVVTATQYSSCAGFVWSWVETFCGLLASCNSFDRGIESLYAFSMLRA